jgi:Flp pilus assembly protein TadG
MFEKLRSAWHDERGTAIVEAAALTPVLFVLIFGVLEFSWYFYDQHRVSTGIRDAARYLSRVADPNDVKLQINAENLAVTGSISGGETRIRDWSTQDVTVSVATIPNPIGDSDARRYRGDETVQVVTVSTTFTHPSLGFLGLLHLDRLKITIAHSARVIGPG